LAWAHDYTGKVHGTRFNISVGRLRAIFKIGVANGLIAENPARSIGKVRVTVRFPSAEQFAAILENVETSGAWCAGDAADLVRFVAYSGCRIDEARNVKREDVNLEAGTIRIFGDPVTGTKGGDPRTVHTIPAMRELVIRLLGDAREPRNKKTPRPTLPPQSHRMPESTGERLRQGRRAEAHTSRLSTLLC
jgi:integrase